MAKVKVRLDSDGIREILASSEVRRMVTDAAHDVASGVNPHRGDVVVENYYTDRAASAIVVQHATAMGMEAKYGYLQRAAAAQGLTVRRKS